MISVNSVSGGKTSAYLAKHYPADYNIFSLVCIDDYNCAPKDKGLIHYVNAKLEQFIPKYGEFIASAEDIQTLEVMRDLEQFLGKEIIWVRGKSFDDVIDLGTQNRLPSWARRYCTGQLKMEPIFYWWLHSIGEKVNMRIGFRNDEFDRMIRFFNNSDPCNFSVPVSCSLKGMKRQKFETYNWRFCQMPLVKDGIDNTDVKNYWKGKTIGGNLFEERKAIIFPEISNCAFCFHKTIEVLMVMAIKNRPLLQWAASQEYKEMGTWLDSRVTYDEIIGMADKLTADELTFLQKKYSHKDASTCDTGGCHD